MVDPKTGIEIGFAGTINRKTRDVELPFTDGSQAYRYDYSNSNVIYVGSNAPGANETDASWLISKYDITSSSDAMVTVAYPAIWSNRLTESYS